MYPGTYALDIEGMDRLYGSAAQLATKLRQTTMAAGFLANMAIAENFHAAVCLALGKTGISVGRCVERRQKRAVHGVLRTATSGRH